MSEEEDDYNTSEESDNEDSLKKQKAGGSSTGPGGSSGGGGGKDKSKPSVLTLEDNDEDSSAFHRPDVTDLFEENGEDEDDEFAGEEDDTLDLDDKPSKTSSKKGGAKSKRNSKSDSRATNDSDEKKSKKKKKKFIGLCLTATKYECVHRVGRKLGFKEVEENEDWTVYWTDTSVSIERVNQMKRWQKINHFPGMSEICRKDFLTRNMNRMAKMFPKDYSFYPKAWCLPADYADLMNYARLKKNKTYICKPDSGCQGRGIFLTKNPYKDIKPGDNYVAQVYVSRPFTIDDYKFDLRVYVAVMSCDPFRIFVYKEGLARFTTMQYEEPSQHNCKDVFMHLTNYAIQKRSDDFIRDEETGTKRRITTINKWLRDHGYDVDKMWADIDEVIIKVLLSAHAVLKHNYRTCFGNHYKGSACFEILGYDILIDRKLKPYVLEVNHSPSFTTDSKLDREIKDALIYDTIMLLNIGATDKKKCLEEDRKKVRDRLFLKGGKVKETKEELDDAQQEWLKQIEKWEDKHMGNYRRVYPGPGTEKYDKFFNTTGTLFSETAASRARLEQAKQQMEEISRKNDKFITNKNKLQNKELRGESPVRKNAPINSQIRSNNNISTTINTAGNNNINNISNKPGSGSATNLANRVKTQYTMRTNSNPFDMSNNNTNNNSSFRRNERPASSVKGINQSGKASSSPNMPRETWLPYEINELDEMERLSALKQRENLLKGMGVKDLVNKILSGTNGTTATIPPVFYNDSNNTNGNNNNNTNNNNLSIQNTRVEIRSKNFNPFDHQLVSEKYINNQHALRSSNLKSKPNPNTVLMKSRLPYGGDEGANVASTNNNNVNFSQYRYPNNNNNSDREMVNENQNILYLQTINDYKRNSSSNRLPTELNLKPTMGATDSNHHQHQRPGSNSMLNGLRIKSAQNVAKQGSGLYIFSYNAAKSILPH